MAASRVPTSIAKTDTSAKFSFVSIDPKNKWQSPLVEEKNGMLNPVIGNNLTHVGLFEPTSKRALVSILAGNVHNATGLIRQQVPYDVIIPSRPDLGVENGARIVPVEQFLDFFRQHYRPFIRFFTLVMEMANTDKVYWVESPPPIESSEHIAENMDQWFKSNYNVTDLVPARASLRYKLWLLNRMVLEEAAKKGGWKLITAPATALEPNGFLARKAWAGDATHGSAWYGEELLKKIKAETAETP